MNARPISDADHNSIVAYALDELDEPARLDFESRLARDTELATEYEEFVEVDLLGQFLAERREQAHQRRGPAQQQREPAQQQRGPAQQRRGLGIFAIAAAALVTLGVWSWITSAGPAGVSFRLALVTTPAVADLRDYAAQIGVPEPERVPATAMRGGDPRRPAVEPRSIEEFIRVVEAAEHRRTIASFGDDARSVEASFVTLRFEPATECSAIVIQLDTAGALRRRFPSPAGVFVFGEVPNRFAAGATHVLPRPVIMANPDRPDRVTTYSGFDVPSDLAVPRIWLLLALRTQTIDGSGLTEIDAMLGAAAQAIDPSGLVATTETARARSADAALGEVERWLRARGFELARVSAATP